MADPRPDADSDDAHPDDAHPGDDAGAQLGRGSTVSTPRWVRVLGIVIGIALVALVVILHLTGTLGPGLNQ